MREIKFRAWDKKDNKMSAPFELPERQPDGSWEPQERKCKCGNEPICDVDRSNMKLFIDDIREAPEGWTLVRNITDAIRTIAFWDKEITEISIDHDISAEVRVNGVYRPFPTDETFASVAYFIGEKYKNLENEAGNWCPKITVHSANPIGCEAIQHILGKYGVPCEIKMMGAAHREK